VRNVGRDVGGMAGVEEMVRVMGGWLVSTGGGRSVVGRGDGDRGGRFICRKVAQRGRGVECVLWGRGGGEKERRRSGGKRVVGRMVSAFNCSLRAVAGELLAG
jgi:hypothetical protein